MTLEDKQYFFDLVATVRGALARRPAGSAIKKYVLTTRLEDIEKKIAQGDAKDLEWGRWQPFFLFLKDASEAAISALDDDLKIVLNRTPNRESQICQFLKDKTDNSSLWLGGLFEVFVKAALIKSNLLTVEAFDWKLPNDRDIDAKVSIGQRTVGVEIMTRGDSTAAKGRWEKHCTEVLTADRDQAFCESQDAYAPGRWLYGTVFNKIAPGFDSTKSQLLPETPNLLLIRLSSVISDLRPESPSIGWALDELFAGQSSTETSPISLREYLTRNLSGQGDIVNELLVAPSQVSGIFLFDHRCRLKVIRINSNAREDCRLSHEEKAIFEKALACSPDYCG
jgi:hypothetical protein